MSLPYMPGGVFYMDRAHDQAEGTRALATLRGTPGIYQHILPASRFNEGEIRHVGLHLHSHLRHLWLPLAAESLACHRPCEAIHSDGYLPVIFLPGKEVLLHYDIPFPEFQGSLASDCAVLWLGGLFPRGDAPLHIHYPGITVVDCLFCCWSGLVIGITPFPLFCALHHQQDIATGTRHLAQAVLWGIACHARLEHS